MKLSSLETCITTETKDVKVDVEKLKTDLKQLGECVEKLPKSEMYVFCLIVYIHMGLYSQGRIVCRCLSMAKCCQIYGQPNIQPNYPAYSKNGVWSKIVSNTYQNKGL